MIKAAIFDLDNCLAAADEPGESLYASAFAAIRQANHGRLSEPQLEAAFADIWRHPLDRVAQQHGFSEAMRMAGWEEFKQLEVAQPMHGYADLPVLPTLPVRRFLVTSGFRRLQESKVRALGCASWFENIYIDAIDEPERKHKRGWFEAIMTKHALRAEEVMAVGDNPDSEIAAGNQLGMKTVQILRPGVPRGENATAYIQSLEELRPMLPRSGQSCSRGR